MVGHGLNINYQGYPNEYRRSVPVVVNTIPIMEVATRAIPQAVLYGSLLIVYYTVNLLPVVLSGIGRASHSGFLQCNS